MQAEERAEFLRELEASGAEADAGQLIDAVDVLVNVRAPRTIFLQTCEELAMIVTAHPLRVVWG